MRYVRSTYRGSYTRVSSTAVYKQTKVLVITRRYLVGASQTQGVRGWEDRGQQAGTIADAEEAHQPATERQRATGESSTAKPEIGQGNRDSSDTNKSNTQTGIDSLQEQQQ